MRKIKILFDPEVYQILMERTTIPPESPYVEEAEL